MFGKALYGICLAFSKRGTDIHHSASAFERWQIAHFVPKLEAMLLGSALAVAWDGMPSGQLYDKTEIESLPTAWTSIPIEYLAGQGKCHEQEGLYCSHEEDTFSFAKPQF